MGLLDKKSWQAQEYYNEYLELKRDLLELVQHRNHFKPYNKPDVLHAYQITINEKVKRLKFVLNELKVVHEIALEDLILLSIGIDV